MADIAGADRNTGEEARPELLEKRQMFFRQHPHAKRWLLGVLLVPAFYVTVERLAEWRPRRARRQLESAT